MLPHSAGPHTFPCPPPLPSPYFPSTTASRLVSSSLLWPPHSFVFLAHFAAPCLFAFGLRLLLFVILYAQHFFIHTYTRT